MYGFVPNRSKARIKWFSEVAKTVHTFSFFESPHRIQPTLLEADTYLVNRPIVLGRELTKAHQEFVRGTASELGRAISAPRGEFTIVVGPVPKVNVSSEIAPSDEEVAKEFWRITNLGEISRRAAITQVAKKYGRSAKVIYSAVERMRKLGE